MNRPEVVSISMVWDSDRPAAEHVAAVYAAIGTELRPTDAFHACVDRAWAARATHHLVGLVTYYGKHYSTFFFHSKLRLWIYFDDADVKEIGPEWSQVVEKCKRGRFQPLLLLYAAVDGTPCDTRHAPKDVIPFPAPEPRRAVTPAPERPAAGFARRAVTPGPDNESDYVSRKAVENMLEVQANRRAQLARSLSTGSASDPHERPRSRRDSGNWSGDRNSASSASSSTPESPYMYTRGRGPGSIPSSPTRRELSSGGSCDAGYDSYSLSSTDSLPLQQSLRHNLQLAQIPKITTPSDSEAIWAEVDRLISKASKAEDAGDFETAIVLCEAAMSKTRTAMEAPYNNPHTITVARLKHNVCLTLARNLQRRMAMNKSSEATQGASMRNTKSGLDNSSGSIEIYATLPKKKGSSKKSPKCVEDDIDTMTRERPPRHKSRDDEKLRDKRSRSEDRGRARKEVSVTNEKKEEPVEDKKSNKKQHKIRRKLLMGGLIRRKNRSMPDLTEGADGTTENSNKDQRVSSVDDTDVGRKSKDDKTNLSGYLSEGHLDYSVSSGTNPNLERSKLMRKSFHGSAGKILTATKVPPPPPLRTTSQLSGTKYGYVEHGKETYTPEIEEDGGFSEQYGDESQSMPYIHSYEDKSVNHYDRLDNSPQQNYHTVVTKAMIHQEQSPVKRDIVQPTQSPSNNIQNLSSVLDCGVDVVDCAVSMRRSPPIFELPPYPSPVNSVSHSRQASEEFPPPPPPIDLTPLQEELNKLQSQSVAPYETKTKAARDTLLALLQEKRNQILRNESLSKLQELESSNNTVNNILNEQIVQNKQASVNSSKQLKRLGSLDEQLSPIENQKMPENNTSVRNIAGRFESNLQNLAPEPERSHIGFVGMSGTRDVINCSDQSNNGIYSRRASSSSIDPKQVEEDNSDHKISNAMYGERSKPKKKSVSFCDQVILVSTAEDQEEDSYIPNPILERVLKSAMNKPELTTMPLQSEKPSLQRQDSFDSQSSRSTISSLSQNSFVPNENTHADYVRVQNTYPTYQSAQSRLKPQYTLQKSTGVYGTNSPVQAMENQNPLSNNQIYQVLPNNTQQNTTSPIPYNQPPSVYSNQSNASPPNFSQNPANRLTPTVHNTTYPAKHTALQRPVPNTYPHPPSQLHQVNQTPSNAYYHRVPQNSTVPTIPNNNYSTNRHYSNAQTNPSPYQCLPSNSPAYQTYHNPPTNYIAEYSSRYPQANASHYNQSHYHRVPPPHGDIPAENYNSYQKIPNNFYHDNTNQQRGADTRHYANSQQQQRSAYNQSSDNNHNDPHGQYQYNQNAYSPYQHVPAIKQLQKKSVSFEPGTKGGTDSPIPPQMNSNSYSNADSQATADKLLCNLCRKKYVTPPSLYCPDCDFYMLRFKPRS